MKKFFSTFFACLLAIGSFFLVCFLVIGAVAAISDKEVLIEKSSILHLKLDVPIFDKVDENPLANFDFMKFKPEPAIGLNTILNNISKAAKDDNIKGILIESTFMQAGMATVEEIRDELIKFKESGKFIVAFGEMFSHKDYYLASVADKVYVYPEGVVQFTGLSSKSMFLKGMLEKLEIEPQIIRHGKFKSAIEPLILEKMSEANREQTIEYISDLWNHMVNGIASSRNLTAEELNIIANELKIQTAQDAVEQGLADSTLYKDELVAILKAKLGSDKDDDLELIGMTKYSKVIDPLTKSDILKDKVAVIYAQGDINSGKGSVEAIGSETLAKHIREARKDDDIKSIVLRVNSPGGSALASDVIWREMNLAKAVKPIVVSMGNVAASGGYYISCPADHIYASENSITGSIGVFGVVPNLKQFFNNKMGITFDGVKTNEYADIQSLVKPLSENERAIIQNGVENIYDDFIGKVAQGRSITKAQVDSIGQGRVWSGIDAKRIGLIDDFGGLNTAIAKAVELAKMDGYQIEEFPKKKDFMESIVAELSGEEVQTKMLKQQLGKGYAYVEYIQKTMQLKGVQARIPYYIEVE